MSEESGKPTGDEVVSKADFEALKATNDKLERDLEDVRMEVLTPEYQKFLDSSKEEKPAAQAKAPETVPDDAFEKMSKKEIFEAAKRAAVDEIRGTLTEREKKAEEETKIKTQREIKAFASTHDDFEKYRPVMYGMSLKPEYADASLAQLYAVAKDHVKGLNTDPSAEEKIKSAKSTNEKPGGDSSSLEKLKSMSNDDIAREAFAEIKAEHGPLPVE